MKRVLITGITGYIGSSLARGLLPEYEVCGLVREPLNRTYLAGLEGAVRLFPYDGTLACLARVLEASRPDVVYHLAAYYTGAHGPEETPKLIDSNLTLGAYLLEAMAGGGCSALVWASTVMVHGGGEAYCPVNLYAATKRAFSDLLAYYTDAGLLRAVTLVLSDTYGPGDRRPKILNLVREAAQRGERLALSDGGQDYDVVYIDDVVRAFRLAGEQLLQRPEWKHETFQAAALQPLSLRQTVERMCAVNGLTLDAAWGERPQPERGLYQAVRRYPPLPGWEPEVPLEEGLRRFVQR